MRARLASLIVVKQEPLSDVGDDYYGGDGSVLGAAAAAPELARTVVHEQLSNSNNNSSSNGYNHVGLFYGADDRQVRSDEFGAFFGRVPTASYGQGDLNNNQHFGQDFQLFGEKKCMYHFYY